MILSQYWNFAIPKLTVNNKFKLNNLCITEHKEIADQFNFFSTTIGPNLTKIIPNSNITAQSYLTGQCVNSFFFSPVTEDDIRILINTLNNSSHGCHDISPKDVNYVTSEIISPLTYIVYYKFVIRKGIFPDL